MIWIPVYFRTVYDLDRERGRYLLTICPPGFIRTPAKLIVEGRQSDTIRADADLILRGPETEKGTDTTANGTPKRQSKFFTGLLPSDFTDVYDGNVLTKGRESKRVKNYLLIRFTPDAGRLTLLYFPGWRPYPNDRANFIREVIGRGLL